MDIFKLSLLLVFGIYLGLCGRLANEKLKAKRRDIAN